MQHDLVFVVKNGLLEPEDKNILMEEKRYELTACAKNLRYEIDSVVKRRTELILSELKVARRKFPTGAKPRSRKNRQAVRGRLVSDGEVRQLLRHYSSLIEEREHILKRDVLKRQKALRDTERKLSIEKERYRPRNNLHNFTIYQLDPKLQTLLEKNGGFVVMWKKPRSFNLLRP